MSFLLPLCEEIPPEALPASDTISAPKSDMSAGEPFISKGTVERSSNCEFLLKIYYFLSFWKSLSSTKLTYTQTFSAIYALTIVLMRTSRKTDFRLWANLINNFSDHDISQSVDWECPSLSPHVLLALTNKESSSFINSVTLCFGGIYDHKTWIYSGHGVKHQVYCLKKQPFNVEQ